MKLDPCKGNSLEGLYFSEFITKGIFKAIDGSEFEKSMNQ
ncbi:hypothetical protein SynMITS9220_01989 [Synechococcus sp. MIT S9220]|nr:hypothetical protein SynMITS9220_01989 [Synechococcus sp. MIT S9220]